MNVGRIYGQVTSCQRSIIHGFPMLRHHWGQTPLIGNVLRSRMFRSECHRRISLYTRLRKGVQHHAAGISRACARQVEYIVVQQIHRAQQASSFYLKLCGSAVMFRIAHSTILRILNYFHFYIGRRCQAVILSASALPVFCWNEERIPDQELLKYGNELEAVACLCHRTLALNSKSASVCGSRKDYYACTDHFHYDRLEDPWELFINQDSLFVWRREVPNHRGEGLYEYKVYGVYSDISAVDFLDVHVDCEFRKEWDTSAIALEILEKEPETNSEVVYWEMQWPRMMSNRDYVYKRRYTISKEQNVIVLVNQNTNHQSAPVKAGKQRVTEYWSIIVIKPHTELDKPGLEFSMTYFDNPGLVFPSAFASWATATGFPDYLNKLHNATLLYAERRIQRETIQKEMEAAAKEERRKQEEQEKKRRESEKEDSRAPRRSFAPETWEAIMVGGPVLSSNIPTKKPCEANEMLNYLINKLVLMVS